MPHNGPSGKPGKRVLAHPANEAAARQRAADMGLELAFDDLVPRGQIFVIDWAQIFSDELDIDWRQGIGRIDNIETAALGSKTDPNPAQ